MFNTNTPHSSTYTQVIFVNMNIFILDMLEGSEHAECAESVQIYNLSNFNTNCLTSRGSILGRVQWAMLSLLNTCNGWRSRNGIQEYQKQIGNASLTTMCRPSTGFGEEKPVKSLHKTKNLCINYISIIIMDEGALHQSEFSIFHNSRYPTYVIITLVYSCINIVITCYHPHLIRCLKLMLKTIWL